MKYAAGCSVLMLVLASCGITKEDLEKTRTELSARIDATEKKNAELSASVEKSKNDSQKALEGSATKIESAEKQAADAQKRVDALEKLISDIKSAAEEAKAGTANMANELTLHREALKENVHYRERLADLLRQMSANMRGAADTIDRAIEALGMVEKNQQDKTDNELNNKVKEQLHEVMRGKDLLRKFPPEAGWGQEKFDELQKKNELAGDEKEFIEGFPVWKKVKSLIDSVKEEEK